MSLRWVDAHCHLNHPDLQSKLEMWFSEALAAGAEEFLLGGVDPLEWGEQIDLAQVFPGRIRTAFGIHPWKAQDLGEGELQNYLGQLITELSKATTTTLGELGLDFHVISDPKGRERQTKAFIEQVKIAKDLGKPIVLHAVKAHSEVIGVLRRCTWQGPGIVHGFTSSLEVANQYLELGLTLGLGPRYIRSRGFEHFLSLPKGSFVLESDAPFAGLGVSNPLLTVPNVAALIAERHGGNAQGVLEAGYQSYRKIFEPR